jgi:hypothetical protein
VQLHAHLLEQADRKGISVEAIREVLASPSTTYDSYKRENGQRVPRICNRHGVQQRKFVGTASDGTALCIAVNTCCRLAITVFADQVETPLRPDQIAKGVRR